MEQQFACIYSILHKYEICLSVVKICKLVVGIGSYSITKSGSYVYNIPQMNLRCRFFFFSTGKLESRLCNNELTLYTIGTHFDASTTDSF